MKRFFYLTLLSVLVLSAGCKKEEDSGNNSIDRGNAYAHVIHAAGTFDTLDLKFDYYNINDFVLYRLNLFTNWPDNGYATLVESTSEDADTKLWLTATRYSAFLTAVRDTVIRPTQMTLDQDQRFTICLVDTPGATIVKRFEDSYSLNATQASVRFINLDAGWPNMYVSNGLDSTAVTNYLNQSAFVLADTGSASFTLKTSTGTPISTIVVDNYQPNRAYTFYLAKGSFRYYYH